jgi:WD40 repeat protein
MVAIFLQLAILGLLQRAHSRNVPTKVRERKVQAPAMPTATLVSDFKKNNVSAMWADGYPKEWGTEDAKFEFPIPPSGYDFSGSVSDDEKFVVVTNTTFVKIVSVDSGATVSVTELVAGSGAADKNYLMSASGGGYNLFVSTHNYTNNGYNTVVIPYSADGKPSGEQTVLDGRFSSFDPTPFSKDGSRLITQSGPRVDEAYVYDLTKPGSSLTLTHNDFIMSGTFSPDGKYIATAAWDGYAKLWDAITGDLVVEIGPTGGQNWVTSFSPDGKYLVVTTGSKPYVRIWTLAELISAPTTNATAQPVIISAFHNWVRDVAWASDSDTVALGSSGIIQIYSMKQQKILQTWESEDSLYETTDLTWFKTQTGRGLAYREAAGLEVYDFQTNLKYRWGPGDYDRYSGSGTGIYLLRKKGWIGGVDGDMTMRFWKFPF